jgi:hypothetical protein
MRAVLAAALSIFLALVALAPHVHAGAHGAEGCAACVATGRGGVEPAAAQVPDVAPVDHVLGEPAVEPALAPTLGAPLGAIPGQSPPHP